MGALDPRGCADVVFSIPEVHKVVANSRDEYILFKSWCFICEPGIGV